LLGLSARRGGHSPPALLICSCSRATLSRRQPPAHPSPSLYVGFDPTLPRVRIEPPPQSALPSPLRAVNPGMIFPVGVRRWPRCQEPCSAAPRPPSMSTDLPSPPRVRPFPSTAPLLCCMPVLRPSVGSWGRAGAVPCQAWLKPEPEPRPRSSPATSAAPRQHRSCTSSGQPR
jgi:hypothetical protein